MQLKKNGFAITGDKELDKLLKDLAPAVAKKILRKALRPAMKPLHKEAKTKAPVLEGDLKRSIKLRAAPRSRSHVGIDVVVSKKDWKGDSNFHASFIELGTKDITPEPFLRPAFDTKKNSAKNDVLNRLPQIIDDEVKKLK